MKSLSPALQAHLDEGTTTLAWCWRITRADGVTFGFTDHDRTLSFDGTDFEPESGLTASEVRSGSDLSVDAQDAEGVLTSDRITETDILDGRWDNAEVEVWRVNWADPSQRVLMRRGAIGQIRRGRLAFVAEVRSLAHVLGQTVGRTFQATCDAALGDARCGVDLENPTYKGTGAVFDLLRDRAFTASGLGGFASGWFTFGTLDWTSGANAGRRTEVLGHDVTDGVAILTLLEAPARAIAEGDAFTIRAGCDKRMETCGGSSRTPPISAASRTFPARTRSCATPRRTAATKGPCCERRSEARHRHRAGLARHALSRPGQPSGRWLRLPRIGPGRLARCRRPRAVPDPALQPRLGRDRTARGAGRGRGCHDDRGVACRGRSRRAGPFPHEVARHRQACRHPDRSWLLPPRL
jgi:uncharacterized phage protein (TIGR02218 family)